MDFLQGKTIIHRGDVQVLADVAFKKKNLILFYFTLNNNKKCKDFDSKLTEVYSEALFRKLELAIVVVPTETDQATYENNIKNNYMEWYSLQFNDDLIRILIFNYGITHVPALVVVRKGGELVTKTGVNEIQNLGRNVLVTWSE